MLQPEVDLKAYAKNYHGGRRLANLMWYCVNAGVFQTAIPFPSSLKTGILRMFGASVGKGVIIKPRVSIKFPRLLAIGNHSWIGEGVWIDNLAHVTMGSNCCISQGALLLTGNHDYTKTSFDLMVREITIDNGVWIGAKAVVCPGAVLRSHSMVTAGSVLTGNADPYTVYQGNPAKPVRKRVIA